MKNDQRLTFIVLKQQLTILDKSCNYMKIDKALNQTSTLPLTLDFHNSEQTHLQLFFECLIHLNS